MKNYISFVEKMGVVNDILEVSRLIDDKLSYIGYEIGKVVCIVQAYHGEKYDIIDKETELLNIVATYENIMQSELWSDFILKNTDAKLLLTMTEKRYEEEFYIENSLETKLVNMLQELISKIPSKEELSNVIGENKEFMDSLDEGKRKLIQNIIG
jgi:capsular polysaccharide biosynthesis protein